MAFCQPDTSFPNLWATSSASVTFSTSSDTPPLHYVDLKILFLGHIIVDTTSICSALFQRFCFWVIALVCSATLAVNSPSHFSKSTILRWQKGGMISALQCCLNLFRSFLQGSLFSSWGLWWYSLDAHVDHLWIFLNFLDFLSVFRRADLNLFLLQVVLYHSHSLAY